MLAATKAFSTFGRRDLGDPYWSNVSLLLQPPNLAGGTNAQFADASGNNVAVTRVGTVANTSDSPYGLGYGAAFFNSNGNYLRLPAIAFGTNDFTIETWIKIDSLNNGALIVDARSANGSSATNGPYMFFGVDSSQGGKLVTYVNTAYRAIGATVVPLGVWNHVAICRSSGTTRLFLNGVLDASWADATNYAAGHPLISAVWFPSTTSVHQMADYRISNGTARYTTNFTPPTAPLEAVTGTSVLLPMQGKILDKSLQANTVNVVGGAQTSTATPFDGIGSLTFGGNGDSVYTTSNLAFGTSDFTIEMWVRPTVIGTYERVIYDNRPTATNGAYTTLFISDAGIVNYTTLGSAVITGTGKPLSVNTWHHVAVSRSGTATRLFVDGTQVGSTYTDTSNYLNPPNRPVIGTNSAYVNNHYAGQIADIRTTKGIARYTQAFTPPTKPLAVTGDPTLRDIHWGQVSLLMQPPALNGGTNTQFVDSSTNNFTVTRFGDVVQTGFSPVANGGSAVFDGSGDYLSVPDNAALQLASGDFTLEFWWYPLSLAGFQTPIDKGYNTAGALVLQTNNGNGVLRVVANGSDAITASSAVTVNTWNHIALVRSGTTMTLYRNGVSVGSATNSTNFTAPAYAWGIGNSVAGIGSPANVNGYMSDVRIVKGTALYTAAFTPPTAPLTAVSGTSLLVNMNNGKILDKSPQLNPIRTAGDAQTSTVAPLDGMGSVTFDGTDSLIVPASSAFTFSTGDFTIEAWVRPTDVTGNRQICSNYGGPPTTTFAFRFSGTSLQFGVGDTLVANIASVASINTWQHIAVSRSGTSLRFFKDGVQIGTTITNSTNLSLESTLHVGTLTPSIAQPFIGQIADLRITKGVARYTSAFTPPTRPLPAQ